MTKEQENELIMDCKSETRQHYKEWAKKVNLRVMPSDWFPGMYAICIGNYSIDACPKAELSSRIKLALDASYVSVAFVQLREIEEGIEKLRMRGAV